MLRATLIAGLLSAGLSLAADTLTGGAFVLTGAPAAGGISAGGAFVISGWVASSGAGTSSGDRFEITCDLLGIYVGPGDGVSLRVELTPTGSVRMWWPADVEGYRLEFTTALGPTAVWTAVEPPPATHSYTTNPTPAARFFRLRLP